MLTIGVDAYRGLGAGLEERAEAGAQRAALAAVLRVAHHARAGRVRGLTRAIRGAVIDDQHERQLMFRSECFEQPTNHGTYAFFRLVGGDHETDFHSGAAYRNLRVPHWLSCARQARQSGPASAKDCDVDLFDSETLADLKYRAKKQLRMRMRGLRAAYPEGVLAQASERIVASVLALPQFSAARGVGLFWPMLERREVDVRPLASAALAAEKRVYFPFMEPTASGFRTGFAQVRDVSELAERGQRFFEPSTTAPRAERGQIELLIVPALAASADGHRLGYGSGFYDATLPDFCPPARALVVVFDFQLLGELPVTGADVASQLIVTDRRTLEP